MNSNEPDKPHDEALFEEVPHEEALQPPALVDEENEPELAELLERMPEELRPQAVQAFTRLVTFRGSVPPPQMLREYEEVLPGLADRLTRLPEREQEQRHRNEDLTGEREYRIKSRGQHYALIGMILILVFCTFIAMMGSLNLAAAVAIALVVGVVSVFVTGKIFEKKAEAESEDE